MIEQLNNAIAYIEENLTEDIDNEELAKITVPSIILKDVFFYRGHIDLGKWAVFNSVGEMPEAMLTTWERVYTEWFPTSVYELAEASELVRSADNDDSKQEIWIPVVKK